MPMFPIITAKWDGWCDECDCKIEKGQEIIVATQINGVAKRWIHIECPEAIPEKPTRFQGTSSEEMGF